MPMTLEDGCFSLKLECALRDLGFVEIGWSVVAHAGLYYVSPVSFTPTPDLSDEILGFQILETYHSALGHIVPTAKRALDIALNLT